MGIKTRTSGIMIPAFVTPTATPETWSPSHKTANITLSNGNLTAATTGGTSEGVYGTVSRTSGKIYWEVHVDTAITPGTDGIGLCQAGWVNGGSAGAGNRSCFWFNDAGIYITDGGAGQGNKYAFSNGDTCCFAADLDNRLFWVRSIAGVNWFGTDFGDPAAGTNGVDFSSVAGAVFPNIDFREASIQFTATFVAPFVGTVPTGYGQWVP